MMKAMRIATSDLRTLSAFRIPRSALVEVPVPDPIANPPDFNWIVLVPQLIVLALALVTLLYDVIVPDGRSASG